MQRKTALLLVPLLVPLLAQLLVPLLAPLLAPLLQMQSRTPRKARWTPPKTKWATRKIRPWKSPKAPLLVPLLVRKRVALLVPLLVPLLVRKQAQWTP